MSWAGGARSPVRRGGRIRRNGAFRSEAGLRSPHRPEQILPIRGGLHRGGVRGVVRTLVIWAGAGAGAVI